MTTIQPPNLSIRSRASFVQASHSMPLSIQSTGWMLAEVQNPQRGPDVGGSTTSTEGQA